MKRITMFRRAFLASVCLLGIGAVPRANAADQPLKILPTPKSLTLSGGAMPLTATSRIVAVDARLKPLAEILSREIFLLTKLQLATATGAAKAGDVVLKIDAKLRADQDILAVQKQEVVRTRDFAHTIDVSDKAVVEGWDYRAVCEGTATLLQAIADKGGRFEIPKMKVKDWPHADFTGTMVDVSRQQIPIDSLKAVIETCRLWKIRYCQLELSSDEAFTFPSTAFPKLGTKNEAMHNGVVPRVYTLPELRELVAFADARGVTLVPELNTPGHTEAMGRSMPELFGGPKIMDMTNDAMYQSLGTLVGEMCDVFKSSPYFHIGCDEMYYYELAERDRTATYFEKNGMTKIDDLIIQHIRRMNDIVRKHGRVTLAWEQVARPSHLKEYKLPAELAKQIISMCWFPGGEAGELQKQGCTTITVPWDLGAPLSEWNMYLCNGAKLAPESNTLGASQTMWHMSASALMGDFLGGKLNGSTMEGYIRSLGIRTERTWGPTTPVVDADYEKRLVESRDLQSRLILPVKIEGTTELARPRWAVLGGHYINDQAEVRLSIVPGAAEGEIHFTLDGTEPMATSPVYSAPISIEKTTALHAALFTNGKQVGHVSRAFYEPLKKATK